MREIPTHDLPRAAVDHAHQVRPAYCRPRPDFRADVRCRFHDLRHTGCTRMLEAGVPLSVVATVMGWSASTTVRVAKRYGHIGQAAQRQAVQALSGADFEGDGAQNWAQSQTAAMTQRAN